jgi:hypothetical protein
VCIIPQMCSKNSHFLVHTKGMEKITNVAAPSELAIVDVFTKLIFGVDEPWSAQELSIVQALRMADNNVLVDSKEDMAIYLRALGVQEMISLVALVKAQLEQPAPLPVSARAAHTANHSHH